jgi:hypothetical protein
MKTLKINNKAPLILKFVNIVDIGSYQGNAKTNHSRYSDKKFYPLSFYKPIALL